MIEIYVGVDPSLNSSGIACLAYEDSIKIDEKFYIIKSEKLTKKEVKAEEENIQNFEYVVYNRIKSEDSENNHAVEYYKSLAAIEVMENIFNSIKKFINKCTYPHGMYELYVCQEGISYGSVSKTKSVFDLAGLNYLLRDMIINKLKPNYFIIATPSEIKKITSGNGNCKKEVMISLFNKIYPNLTLPKIDDVADAFWMQNYIKLLKDTNKI